MTPRLGSVAQGEKGTTTRVSVRDLVPMTSRTITPEGYLTAPSKLARTGVQPYKARELGLDKSMGMDAARVINLYRPPEEVFAADAVGSFESKPVTLQHPPEDVTDANWKKYAVGDVRDVKANGPMLHGNVIVRDRAAIRAVMDGKAQLSGGYSFDLDLTPGTSPDGIAYDGIQRKITGNHVAIVDTGRAGAGVRIGDSNNGDKTMRKIVVDGIAIELGDTEAAIVEKSVADAASKTKAALDAAAASDKRATDAETLLAAEKAAHAKAATDHAAKLTELEGKILKPEAIEALAADRAKVVQDATRLAPEVKPEGKTVAAIRTEVLAHVIASDQAGKAVATAALGGADPAKASPEAVKIAFDVVAASRVVTEDGRSMSARDAAYAKALASPSRTDGPGGGKPALSGRDVFIYRQNHAGRAPGDKADA